MSTTDIAFTPAVQAVQTERGSRGAYAKVEARGGFESLVTYELEEFLLEIDSAFVATASADGQPYVQHRGGAKGFLRVVDEHTLGWFELAGNRQYITTGNLSENSRVCIFLIDYATRRRVKVWGTARVVPAYDPIAAKLGPAPRGKVEHIVLVTVKAWDINCPQHIPVKLDAVEVKVAITELQQRIRVLEEENRRLVAEAAKLAR